MSADGCFSEIYIELYNYHYETLYALCATPSSGGRLLLLGARGKHEYLEAIDARKRVFTVMGFVRSLVNGSRPKVVLNSLNVNLFSFQSADLRIFATLLLVPVLAKMFGCPLEGVLHEADQFLKLDSSMNRRHRVFRALIGGWLIKLFSMVYVLSPEVQSNLQRQGYSTRLLSGKCFKKIARETTRLENFKRVRIAVPGAFDSGRRDWSQLKDLDYELLKASNVEIDLVCDIREREGPQFLDFLKQSDSMEVYQLRFSRPSDVEYVTALSESDAVLCLYSNAAYGSLKTAGARFISDGLSKMTIESGAVNCIKNASGEVLHEAVSLSECIYALVQITAAEA